MTYTINPENNIVAGVAGDGEHLQQFSNQKELSKLAAAWPPSRLVDIWNSFAGVAPFDDLRPVKKFPTHEIAVQRVWAAITRLAGVDKPATPKAARKAQDPAKKESAKKRASIGTSKTGLRYEREYKGKKYSLHSIERDGKVVFKLRGGETYESLTAAAKGITEYPSISGPVFWGEGTRDTATAAGG